MIRLLGEGSSPCTLPNGKLSMRRESGPPWMLLAMRWVGHSTSFVSCVVSFVLPSLRENVTLTSPPFLFFTASQDGYPYGFLDYTAAEIIKQLGWWPTLFNTTNFPANETLRPAWVTCEIDYDVCFGGGFDKASDVFANVAVENPVCGDCSTSPPHFQDPLLPQS